MNTVTWSAAPEEHDYPAAASYLSLLAPQESVQRIVAALQQAPVEIFKAKDVMRAARLPLLTTENSHVDRDLKKIKDGKALSPILLVRGSGERGIHLTIADGYHRACAVYCNSEDDVIHAKIVDWS
jgi:hypothetical protein